MISTRVMAPISTLAMRIFVSGEDEDPTYDRDGNEYDNDEMGKSEGDE